MARNLNNKIAKSDTLILHDVNTKATDKFRQETEGPVEVAQDVKEVADRSVS